MSSIPNEIKETILRPASRLQVSAYSKNCRASISSNEIIDRFHKSMAAAAGWEVITVTYLNSRKSRLLVCDTNTHMEALFEIDVETGAVQHLIAVGY